jgi:hypothetical protein
VSALVEARVLEDLERRAGASDKDRARWLYERAHGATATQVRDLWLKAHGYHGLTVDELIAEKLPFLLAGTDKEIEAAAAAGFQGNAYTAWGNEREPIIAAQLLEAYGMLPESRVFRSIANPRHLASPDGLRVDVHGRIEVAEIKTSGKPVPVGSAAYVEKGYGIQQQWVMGVLGADRSLYAWELREGRPGEFESGHPFGVDVEWVEFDADLFAELVVLADHFLERLDAALAAALAGEGPRLDEELDTLAVNYLRGLDLEKQAKALKEPAFRAMFERIESDEAFVQESPLARVSFSPEIVEERPVFAIDADAARRAAPAGLYERLKQATDDALQASEAVERERLAVDAFEAEFVRQTGVERVVVKKAALRVTAARETKEQKA